MSNYNRKTAQKYLNPNKCCLPTDDIDMGISIQFASAIPGTNNAIIRPFGWTEYDASYRPTYVPKPRTTKPCRDPCLPCPPQLLKSTVRPKEYLDPCRVGPRQNACHLCHKAKCCCRIEAPWSEGKEKVMVYEKDAVRQLFVHHELRNEHAVLLCNDDYGKVLKRAAQQPSKDDEFRECREALERRLDFMTKSRDRGDAMRKADKEAFNAALCSQESQQEDMQEICERANTLVMEDQPEIRTLNQLILAAKVQAIREAQLEERKLIKCEETEEENRILAEMALNPIPILQDDSKNEAEQSEKKRAEAEMLKRQMQEYEAKKYLEKIQTEYDNEQARLAYERMEMEELAARQAKAQLKHQLGKQLLQDQMLHIEMKKQSKLLDQKEDEQMLEWIEKKEEERLRWEQEQTELKRLKEQQREQLWSTFGRGEESKLMREDMRTRRHQEQLERQWRNRERSELIKKKLQAEELKEGIVGQIKLKNQVVADQAAMDKAHLEQIFEYQTDKEVKSAETSEQQKLKKLQYKTELEEQIHRFQLERIQERKDHFVEGVMYRKDLQKREVDVRCAMKAKLNELRCAQMPERYIKNIEKAMAVELLPVYKKKINKV